MELEVFEKFMKKDEEKYPQLVRSILALKESLSLDEYASVLEEEMYRAASELRYEDAAALRDELYRVREKIEG